VGGAHIPVEPPQQELPDPIPSSYYARPEAGQPQGRQSLLALGRRTISGFRERPLQQQVVAVLVCLAVVAGAVIATLALSSTGPPGAGRQQALTLPPSATATPVTAIATPSLPAVPSAGPATPRPTSTPRLLSSTPTPAPTPPGPTQVAFNGGNFMAHEGQDATMSVTTAPNISCTLTVGYQGAPPPATTTSSPTGSASWTWFVADNAPLGSWPVTAACGSGSASTTIRIKPQN
jgi:hypothetical protein